MCYEFPEDVTRMARAAAVYISGGSLKENTITIAIAIMEDRKVNREMPIDPNDYDCEEMSRYHKSKFADVGNEKRELAKNIPPDIMEACHSEFGYNANAVRAANLIYAERERCAAVARKWVGHAADYPFCGK